MRAWILLVLASLLLAGCAGPLEPTFDPTCPSWIQGRTTHSVHTYPIHENSSKQEYVDLQRLPIAFQDHPLDRIEMSFQWDESRGDASWRGVFLVDQRLTLRLTDNATGEPMEGYFGRDGPGGPRDDEFVFGPGEHTNFTIFIDMADSSAPPAPRLVNATWQVERNVDGDDATTNRGEYWYDSRGWYRTCNTDGSPTEVDEAE